MRGLFLRVNTGVHFRSMDDRSIDEDPEAVGEDELVEDDEEMLPADDSPEATAEAGLTSEPLELEEPE